MFPIPLRTPAQRTDRYGRPWFPVEQARGLAEQQSFDLVRRAEASGYLDAVGGAIYGRVAAIAHRLAGSGRLDIVELGGGDGALFDHVRDIARTYINVEPGELTLAPEALRRLADPLYASVRCSAEDLPLQDASADLILAVASIDHVPDPHRALSEAKRIVRPGGYVIVTLNNRRSWWKTLLSRTRYLAARERAIAVEHSVLWSLRECADAVARSFDVVDARSMIHVPYVPAVWRALLPIACAIGDRVAARKGAHSIVIGRAC